MTPEQYQELTDRLNALEARIDKKEPFQMVEIMPEQDGRYHLPDGVNSFKVVLNDHAATDGFVCAQITIHAADLTADTTEFILGGGRELGVRAAINTDRDMLIVPINASIKGVHFYEA